MNKNIIIKYIVYTIGVLVLGAGIAISDASLLGTDSFSVLLNAVTKITGISMGIVNAFVCALQIVIGYIFDRKNVTLATFISLFASSIGIDLMAMFMPSNPSTVVKVILMIVGILVYTFGTALSEFPHCGYNTYDCLIFSMANIFHTNNYAHVRWGVDGAFLIVGYLLGGTVGICTVLVFVTAGKLVEFYLKLFKKMGFSLDDK